MRGTFSGGAVIVGLLHASSEGNNRRSLVAVDAATGEKRWVVNHVVPLAMRRAPAKGSEEILVRELIYLDRPSEQRILRVEVATGRTRVVDGLTGDRDAAPYHGVFDSRQVQYDPADDALWLHQNTRVGILWRTVLPPWDDAHESPPKSPR